jgi:hypothetical protein
MMTFAVIRILGVLAALPCDFASAGLDACNAGDLANVLSHREAANTELTTQELLQYCEGQYSAGICVAVGHSLSNSLSSELKKGKVSLAQFASLACNAMEATLLQQRALLLRRGREDKAKDSKLESGLSSKSIPLPHGTFMWEYKSSNGSSLAAKVHKYREEVRSKVNVTSPDVSQRALAFTSYITTSTKPKVVAKTKSSAPKKKGSHLQEAAVDHTLPAPAASPPVSKPNSSEKPAGHEMSKAAKLAETVKQAEVLKRT